MMLDDIMGAVNIDDNSPLGVSIYANALSTLKALDVCYESGECTFSWSMLEHSQIGIEYYAQNGVQKMKHLGDITKIYNAPFVDCITFGSPCQDLSIAGKRAGAPSASQTRRPKNCAACTRSWSTCKRRWRP